MDTETSAMDGPRPYLHANKVLCLRLDSQKDLDGKLTNRHVEYVATCFCKIFDWRKVFQIRKDLKFYHIRICTSGFIILAVVSQSFKAVFIFS